ncbi:MAG TPA: hypothetical protein VKE74_03495 [Gemmataceae bacterium]|nr:hypothetical protein [Gemmataceae bacterium]
MRCCLPTRVRFPLGGFVAAVPTAWLVAGLLSVGVAQEKQPEKQTDEKAELAEFLDDARHYTIKTTKPEAVLKLHEPPVLNFTNPERNQERGSVFVWMQDGRPAVMGQFFRFDVRDQRPKKHALHSLVQVPLEAKFNDRLAWTPEEPGVEWKSFPEAPAVGATKKERLSQMKQLAQRVKVNMTDPKDKENPIELRRLDRPLFEYAAPKQGVTDGAIFSYVVATDPEAILLIEAFDEQGKTGFRYALARFHFWRLTATLGDKTVWDVEYDPAMSGNRIGNPATIKRVYNSYHP